MIDHSGTVTARHTVPRHRATPGPRPMLAGLWHRARNGAGARLRTIGLRAGTWAVAGGLAAASIGVLATVMIANGWHTAPRPHLAAPSSAASGAVLPLYLPHRAYRPPVAKRHRRPRHRHAPELVRGTGGTPNLPARLSGLAGMGAGTWRQLATRAGVPPWLVDMLAARASHPHDGDWSTMGRPGF